MSATRGGAVPGVYNGRTLSRRENGARSGRRPPAADRAPTCISSADPIIPGPRFRAIALPSGGRAGVGGTPVLEASAGAPRTAPPSTAARKSRGGGPDGKRSGSVEVGAGSSARRSVRQAATAAAARSSRDAIAKAALPNGLRRDVSPGLGTGGHSATVRIQVIARAGAGSVPEGLTYGTRTPPGRLGLRDGDYPHNREVKGQGVKSASCGKNCGMCGGQRLRGMCGRSAGMWGGSGAHRGGR